MILRIKVNKITPTATEEVIWTSQAIILTKKLPISGCKKFMIPILINPFNYAFFVGNFIETAFRPGIASQNTPRAEQNPYYKPVL